MSDMIEFEIFFAFFDARFSFMVMAGFFFDSLWVCWCLLMESILLGDV